jgi:hypothetical protein
VAKEEDVVVYDGTKDESEEKRDKKVKKNGSSKKSKGDKMIEVDKGLTKDGGKVQEEKAMASRPADEGQSEGDREKKPAQGGSEVNPEITDGPKQDGKAGLKEDEEDRSKMEKRFARAAKTARGMPSEITKDVQKEKDKAGMTEDLQRFNALYKENLERALANNKVENVRDLSDNVKSKLFKHVEEATYSSKQIKMAKGIAFDKRYKGGNMTGAAKQMDKIKKGLSDHPSVNDALRRANEEVEQVDEISKDLAGRYKTAAQKDRKNTEARLKGAEDNNNIEGPGMPKNPRRIAGDDKYFKDSARSTKRTMGIAQANKRIKESKMASKDHDGDGKIESGKDEYFGSKDKAIKKAMAKKNGRGDGLKKFRESYQEVLEGAKEDAMRDMSRDTKGMAPVKKDPKPGKSKHDGSENKGPAHIVSQLRGVLDQGDKHGGVKFKDGKTHKISTGDAHKYLNKYMKGKPQDKMKMQDHGHASHDNFKTHLD